LIDFIKHNATTHKIPKEEVTFEEFKLSEDLKNYKEFLAKQTKDLKLEVDKKMRILNESEKVKERLHDCIQNIIYHK
jgi:hypothetical protein